MSRFHALLGCGLTVLACAAAPSAEETPQEVLASKELRQSGATFLLRAEDEVKKAAEAVEDDGVFVGLQTVLGGEFGHGLVGLGHAAGSSQERRRAPFSNHDLNRSKTP